MQATKRIARLNPSTSLFFLCDIQNVFKSLIHKMDRVEQTASFMARVAKTFDIPVIVTEHNHKAFGPIVESVKANVDPETSKWFHKTRFSMCTDEILNHLVTSHKDRKSIVLFGIEAHVCVQQTTLELLENGYEVHLVADGISSQREHDRTVALQRMMQSGAFVTTSESIAFELAKDAKHPQFKSLIPLFKEQKKSEFERL